jgi:hypothetical protein
LTDQPRVTLRADNYPAWKDSILADAKTIDAKDILEEEQIYPPEGLDLVEEALWKERSKVLYTRISASLHYSVRKVADSLETKCPVTM